MPQLFLPAAFTFLKNNLRITIAKHPSSKVQHARVSRRSSPEWGKEQMLATLWLCNKGGGFQPSSHQRLCVSAFAGALIQFETCDNAFATVTGFSFLVVAVWRKVRKNTDRKGASEWIIYGGRYEIQPHPGGAAVTSSHQKREAAFTSVRNNRFNPAVQLV